MDLAGGGGGPATSGAGADRQQGDAGGAFLSVRGGGGPFLQAAQLTRGREPRVAAPRSPTRVGKEGGRERGEESGPFRCFLYRPIAPAYLAQQGLAHRTR
jgi:hypothetical protein